MLGDFSYISTSVYSNNALKFTTLLQMTGNILYCMGEDQLQLAYQDTVAASSKTENILGKTLVAFKLSESR